MQIPETDSGWWNILCLHAPSSSSTSDWRESGSSGRIKDPADERLEPSGWLRYTHLSNTTRLSMYTAEQSRRSIVSVGLGIPIERRKYDSWKTICTVFHVVLVGSEERLEARE